MDTASSQEQIRADNGRVLRLLSYYLNLTPAAITAEMMDGMSAGMDEVNRNYAYASLLAASCGLMPDIDADDKALFRRYFVPMVHRADRDFFLADPYYRNIRPSDASFGKWEFRRQAYLPYEAFVCDETEILPNSRIRPNIGYFPEGFLYPAVLENGKEWMTVTPHEVMTIRRGAETAAGNVVTYGLGLGYFAYLAARKDDVKTVTVVERDADLIAWFTASVLPSMECRDKIRIVNADAFDFAENELRSGAYDFVYADLWHDASDGVELYTRLKDMERCAAAGTRFAYWIEKTLLYYRSLAE